MAKRDREKLRKAKARKDKRAQAAKIARDEAKDAASAADGQSQNAAGTSGSRGGGHPFGVDSVGRSTGGGAPRMPRRNKKG